MAPAAARTSSRALDPRLLRYAQATRSFIAGSVMLLVFLLLVVQPGVERGGVQEILIIGAIFAAVLLFERYLRSR